MTDKLAPVVEVMARFRYSVYWLSFKTRGIFTPWTSATPGASTVSSWSVHRTRWGFIIWRPGVPRCRCSTRVHVSWKSWAEGPCNYATWWAIRAGQWRLQ